MPVPSRSRSVSSSRLDTQYETLYNTAIQSFVRRDHSTTQITLQSLLKLIQSQPLSSRRNPWYDLAGKHYTDEGMEGWMIKTLKLVISSHVSLYSDPPANNTTVPSDLRPLLPPTPPDKLLTHIQDICTETYLNSPSSRHDPSSLLPPTLLSTLLLASLKLSLPFAHRLAEDWLSLIPDSFILAISQSQAQSQAQNGKNPLDPEIKKRIESAREGYLKVVDLFVGEILARQGEFEMARGFLEGEVSMGSKRKEVG